MNARKLRRTKKRDREEESLDEALKETFPASDPPAMIGPGGGITGAEDDGKALQEDRAPTKPMGTKRRRLLRDAKG